MARFLLLADTHFHEYPGPTDKGGVSLQFVALLESVLRAVLEARADVVVHLGDLFHNRPSLTTTCLAAVASLMRNIAMGKDHRVQVLMGNHDLSPSGDGASSVGALQGVIDAHTNVETADFLGVRWGFIPYCEDPKLVARACRRLESAGASVIAGHLGLGDPKFSACVPADYEVPGRISVRDLHGAFKRVFLGHYHEPQKVTERITYIGSPIQLTFGDAGAERGYWVWDSDVDKLTFHPDERSPRYIKVKSGAIPEVRAGDHIWVSGVDRQKAAEIRERFAEKNVSLRVDQRVEQGAAARLPVGVRGADLLKAYVRVRLPDCDGTEIEELIRVGKEILDGGRK